MTTLNSIKKGDEIQLSIRKDSSRVVSDELIFSDKKDNISSVRGEYLGMEDPQDAQRYTANFDGFDKYFQAVFMKVYQIDDKVYRNGGFFRAFPLEFPDLSRVSVTKVKDSSYIRVSDVKVGDKISFSCIRKGVSTNQYISLMVDHHSLKYSAFNPSEAEVVGVSYAFMDSVLVRKITIKSIEERNNFHVIALSDLEVRLDSRP